MTADELKVLKKIEKNLSSMQMHYSGPGPDKRGEVFALLKQLIRGGSKEEKSVKKVFEYRKKQDFDRGYLRGVDDAATALRALETRLREWKVPPEAYKTAFWKKLNE